MTSAYFFLAETIQQISEKKLNDNYWIERPIFFYKTNRLESIRITNRIQSIRIANWNALLEACVHAARISGALSRKSTLYFVTRKRARKVQVRYRAVTYWHTCNGLVTDIMYREGQKQDPKLMVVIVSNVNRFTIFSLVNSWWNVDRHYVLSTKLDRWLSTVYYSERPPSSKKVDNSLRRSTRRSAIF